MGQQAILICNGLTAHGYQPPADVFSVCINGGFREHRADAAFTVDCPSGIKAAWREFKGLRVMAAHNAMFPFKPCETFECEELVRKFHSATPAAMLWIAKRGFTRLLVVGCDSLLGLCDKPGGFDQAGHKAFFDLLSTQFPEGIEVLVDGKVLRWEELRNNLGPWAPVVAKASPAQPVSMRAKRKEEQRQQELANLPPCKIPQTMVEFDASNRCTRNCAFCAPGIPPGRRKLKAALSVKNHNRVIDQLVEAGFNRPERWLCYCGHGEPLLNKSLVIFLRYAREKLPHCKICVYTNGDPLTVDLCCKFEALDVDVILWDCYDQKSATDVPSIIKRSSLDPSRVRVNDYREGFPGASSRAGTVRESKASEWGNKPCAMPAGKLFFTDDNKGKGGSRWLVCCEDYARLTTWDGKISPEKLNEDPTFKGILESLRNRNRKCSQTCSQCDRDGGHPNGFAHVPALTASAIWKEHRLPPVNVDGDRLVVLLANAKWANHARVLMDTIDRVSTMRGKTLLIWNDTVPMPDTLKGENRLIWRYKEPLGWCGISRGLARAYRYCVESNYRWMIKLDTDTAILRRGWDAEICSDCPDGSMSGTYMDAAMTDQIRDPEQNSGLFTRQLERDCRWARGLVRTGRRRFDHIQGGCYCISVEALRRIDDIVGLGAEDQEAIAEGGRIGEDVYIDSKAKLACIPQRDSQCMRIWFREPGRKDFALDSVRHLRDTRGACVAHPIKELESLVTLAEEIA